MLGLIHQPSTAPTRIIHEGWIWIARKASRLKPKSYRAPTASPPRPVFGSRTKGLISSRTFKNLEKILRWKSEGVVRSISGYDKKSSCKQFRVNGYTPLNLERRKTIKIPQKAYSLEYFAAHQVRIITIVSQVTLQKVCATKRHVGRLKKFRALQAFYIDVRKYILSLFCTCHIVQYRNLFANYQL